jgi:hypothetical protein
MNIAIIIIIFFFFFLFYLKKMMMAILVVIIFFFLICFSKKKTTLTFIVIVFFFFLLYSIHPCKRKHWPIFNPKSIGLVNVHHFDYIIKFEKKTKKQKIKRNAVNNRQVWKCELHKLKAPCHLYTQILHHVFGVPILHSPMQQVKLFISKLSLS